MYSGDAEATATEHFFALSTGTKPYAKDIVRWKELAWNAAERGMIDELANMGKVAEARYIMAAKEEDMDPEEVVALLRSMGLDPATLPQ